ncbi:MAG: dihydroorotase family protein [Candidatus Ornithospirochaeta sp.]|nr:dihydroorotase family protein [Candidatus Ornithospirochaeta sp.]
MIDPHVHFRDWSQSSKETVKHGLYVASRLGFTHVFDMPNTDPALTCSETVLRRLELARASCVEGISYHVYCGLTPQRSQIEEAVELTRSLFPSVIGLKLFAGQSTGNMGIIGMEREREVFRVLKECHYRGVLAVHAEKQELIDPSLYVPGDFRSHSRARKRDAEIESIRDIIRLAMETGFEGRLHIAHVSTSDSIDLVTEMRSRHMDITMGATPHHSLLDESYAGNASRYLKMNPPLRDESDRRAVFEALLDGRIDWVESDHAPHTIEDKEKGASGIPALPAMMLLLSELRKAGCSEEHLARLFGGNASDAYSIEDETSLPSDPLSLYDSMKGEYPFDPFGDYLE